LATVVRIKLLTLLLHHILDLDFLFLHFNRWSCSPSEMWGK